MKQLSIIAVFMIGIAIPFIIAAQQNQNPGCGPQSNGSYKLCTAIPGVDPVQKDFTGLLKSLYQLAFVLAGTTVFIRVVYGGFLYMFSGIIENKQKAKGILWGTAQGLALLMGSYVILYAINPALVTLNAPEVKDYLPSISSQQFNSDFEKRYADMMSGQAARSSRIVETAQNNLRLINDEIQSLEKIVNPSPENAKRLEELKNKRAPEAQKQLTLYQEDTIQFKINAISGKIEDLENKKGQAGNGTSQFFGVTKAFSAEEERQLLQLYKQRLDLRLQKSGEGNLLLKKDDRLGKYLTPEEKEGFLKMLK